MTSVTAPSASLGSAGVTPLSLNSDRIAAQAADASAARSSAERNADAHSRAAAAAVAHDQQTTIGDQVAAAKADAHSRVSAAGDGFDITV